MSQWFMTRVTMACCATLLAANIARAQQREPPADFLPFTMLRADGNGIDALRATTEDAYSQITAAVALRQIAMRARLNLTFDPTLSGLTKRVEVRKHKRSIAEALLEVATAAGVYVVVSHAGELVVLDRAPARVIAQKSDTTPFARGVASLPPVHTTASRVEWERFQSKPNVSSTTIANAELHRAPRFFAEADLLRSVQLLPGVQARNDYYAGLNVRGGEADQNLVLLDGYPIYNPFHLGGLFGTFIDPAVGRIDLSTGGYPATYSGRLSSVLDVRTAEETRRGIHGTGSVSLIASSGSLAGAMGDGKGSWIIAARRTYADRLVDMAQNEQDAPYHFTDVHAHVTRELMRNLRASLTVYDGRDQLGRIERFEFLWGNRVIGATIAKSMLNRPTLFGVSLGDSAVVEQRVSASRFAFDLDLREPFFRWQSGVRDLRAGGSMTTFQPRHERRIGYELSSQRLWYSASRPLPLVPVDSSAQSTMAASAFYDEVWRPNPSWIVNAGLRLDAVTEARWMALMPRVSAKYFVNDQLALTASAGEYAQWMRSIAREDVPIRPLDFWVGSDSLAPVSRARHVALGMERWIGRRRSFRLEAFYKSYRQLLEPNPFDDATQRGDELLSLRGRSYGVDLLLRQYDSGRFTGWVAYTFAVSRRMMPDGRVFFPAQDRRHDLNAVGSWRLGAYTLGTRYNFATGTPYTSILGDFRRRPYNPATHSYDYGEWVDIVFLTGSRNAERLPLTQRLDVSIARAGRIRGVEVSPYLSIMNVFSAPNIFGYTFDFAKHPPERVGLPQIPVFPTIGVSIAW